MVRRVYLVRQTKFSDPFICVTRRGSAERIAEAIARDAKEDIDDYILSFTVFTPVEEEEGW